MEKGQIRRSAQTYRADHRVPKGAKWNRTQWTRYISLDASSLQFLDLYELCRTSQVMIWCDLFCVIFLWSSLYKYNVLAFLTLFWRVCSLQISFCIEKKNNQSIFVKRFCIRQEDVTCELGATFHKAGVPHPFSHSSPSLTSYSGQVLLSWKLDSCPTFSQNKQ